MQHEHTFVPMTKEYLEPATELFIGNYKREQEESPLLPSRGNLYPYKFVMSRIMTDMCVTLNTAYK